MRVAGIMSGTSLDGIDVAIVDISGKKFSLVALHSAPYSKRIRNALLSVLDARAISRLNFQLGELYAKAVIAACRKVSLKSVDLIGCHGQTIFHEPTSTLQIGEASVIAERTGIPVVSDFRTRDIAAGGQGAPLVPFVDYRLFRHPRRSRVALNIGGIANITAIPAGAKPGDVIAFDTGPGNMIIDRLAGRKRYDRDGRMAARGRVDQALVTKLLADPYYSRKPPKTAGREQYGSLAAGSIATATELTVRTIALGIERFAGFRPDDLIVSGGGAKNFQILRRLRELLPDTRIMTSAEFGIPVEAKEAIAFAILAHETWRRRPSNLPSATGARRAVVLGKLTL